MDIGTGWEAMLESGLQGIAFQEIFGPAEESAPESMRALQAKIESYRGLETETRRIGVSPHAPYTVSSTLYRDVRDYARREKLRMSAHIAESAEETAFVRHGTGRFADAHRKRNIPVIPRLCSPVAHLDQQGLLGPDMLLVHAIETDPADLDRICETGTYVAHCPKSNAYFGHGVAPVAAMRRRGSAVCLGTDSIASNDAFDMFAEMRAVVAQQKLGVEDVFRMATIEGARALGLESLVGSLDVGKRADFAVVGLKGSEGNPLDVMVRSAQPSDIRATFIGGREVVFDVENTRAEVREIQRRLESSE
jgi:5-methylthioadenosine/S-adenosylhomocysteine deaminase